METIDIPDIHEQILKLLLDWRQKNPGFTFTLRKSDLSKRLSKGYWFHGNDEYIAISFWSGMDWQSKVPNISFVIIPVTGECYLQFSAKDSIEKDELIQNYFEKNFELSEEFRAFYNSQRRYNDVGDYLKSIESFLQEDKIKIDKIILRNKKRFETKQNPKNRIGFITELDFAKNLKKTLHFQKIKKSTYNIPIGLFEIEIENYGLIKHLILNDIPTDAQWIFFTGENGSGKTTILKALATALTNTNNLGQGSGTYLRSNYSIGLTLQKNGKKSQKHRIKKNKSNNSKELKILSKGFVCFGPVRLNIQDPDNKTLVRTNKFGLFSSKNPSINLLQTFDRPYLQLFSTNNPLIDIGYVYNRNFELSKELKYNEEKLKFIIESITSICTSIIDIHFGKGMRYFEVDKNNKLLNEGGTPFQNLASGYKSIIAMVSHMMLHLYYQQPEISDPSLLEGIVIIDEIDLHFHPKMQRDLVIKLSEIFPRIQFIASTHSPIPLLGVPSNTPIFTSKIDSERGVYIERMDSKVMLKNILPNALLTSPIFDLEKITPIAHNKEIQLNTEDTFAEVVFNKRIREEIQDYITDKKEKEFIKLFSKKT